MISNHSTIKLKVEDKWEEILTSNEQKNWKSIWKFNLKAIKKTKFQNLIQIFTWFDTSQI